MINSKRMNSSPSPEANELEFRAIVGINQKLKVDYRPKHAPWKASQFAWIRMCSSRTRGGIGEKMIASWLKQHGFDIQSAPDREADWLVQGKRVEVKFSTLWEDGAYRFQQIRDQNYDFMIMLGISPVAAHIWVIPKDDLMKFWDGGVLRGQHTGNDASETAWIRLFPDNDNPHFASWGNGLDKALVLISKLTSFKAKPLSP